MGGAGPPVEGLRTCGPCAEDWQRFKSVAFDQWQTLRRSTTAG